MKSLKLEPIKRTSNDNDLDKIFSLFTETKQQICKNNCCQNQIEMWSSTARDEVKWKEYLHTGLFLAPITKNKIVGYGSLQKGHHTHLLYVHRSYQRCGTGTVLNERLKDESQDKGPDHIISDVSITARPFFISKEIVMIRKNRRMVHGIELINYSMGLNAH